MPIFDWPTGAVPTDDGCFLLRTYRRSDAAEFAVGINDRVVQRWIPFPPHSTDMAVAWCSAGAEAFRVSGAGLHLAVTTADGRLLGNLCLKHTDWRKGVTEVGYWMLPAGRGRGAATASCRTLSRWALAQEPIHRVVLVAAAENTASCRVAEKAGFVFEGLARSGGILHSGRTDLRIYSLIRADLSDG
jgi:RimJ/RimL family protein N-acetyltransferase